MISGGIIVSPGFDLADFINRDEEQEKASDLGSFHFFESEKVWAKLVRAHTVLVSDGTVDVIRSGDVLYQTATANVVTNDRSEAVSDNARHFVGIAPQLDANVPESVGTTIYYFWMIVPHKGTRATVRTNGDDNIVAGDAIIASGDGTCDSTATPESVDPNTIIGRAAAADNDAANTVSVDFI